MNRKVNEKQHGSKIAENAETIGGWGTPAGQLRAKRRADLLIEGGHVAPTRTVLEIGCGTGLFSRSLAQTGACVIAIDLSWDLIIQVGNGEKANILPTLADAEFLPFPSGVFDAVVGSSVLHYLQLVVALGEVYRALRVGDMWHPPNPTCSILRSRSRKNPAYQALAWRFARSLIMVGQKPHQPKETKTQ